MGKKHNQYTKECEIEAVRLIVEEDRPIYELAPELGTAQSLLRRWKKKSVKEKLILFRAKVV
jgi:transposase-like protein